MIPPSAADAGVERAKHLANKIVRLLNRAQHPADAMTALQFVVASVIEHTGVDPQVFMHRVLTTVENIRRGALPVKEETRG